MSISLFSSYTHTHTHTHTVTLSHKHQCMCMRECASTHSLTHIHTTLSLSLSHTHTPLSLSHTHTLSHTHSLTHIHSLSKTHTHINTLSPTHNISTNVQSHSKAWEAAIRRPSGPCGAGTNLTPVALNVEALVHGHNANRLVLPLLRHDGQLAHAAARSKFPAHSSMQASSAPDLTFNQLSYTPTPKSINTPHPPSPSIHSVLALHEEGQGL